MSQENIELVRRGVQSVEAFWALLDEYVVWDLRDYPILDLDGVYVGRDAVVEASRHWWAPGPSTSSTQRSSSTQDRALSSPCAKEAGGRAAVLHSSSDLRRYGPLAEAESSA